MAHRLRREQLSEELRLLYVAMTRARERLIITCALGDPQKEAAKLAVSARSPMPAEALAGMRSAAGWLISAAIADGGRTISLEIDAAEQPSGRAAEGAGAQEGGALRGGEGIRGPRRALRPGATRTRPPSPCPARSRPPSSRACPSPTRRAPSCSPGPGPSAGRSSKAWSGG